MHVVAPEARYWPLAALLLSGCTRYLYDSSHFIKSSSSPGTACQLRTFTRVVSEHGNAIEELRASAKVRLTDRTWSFSNLGPIQGYLPYTSEDPFFKRNAVREGRRACTEGQDVAWVSVSEG